VPADRPRPGVDKVGFLEWHPNPPSQDYDRDAEYRIGRGQSGG
jgi:hypothetical protein